MQDERLQEIVDKLQGRFKAAASMLGVLQDYFPKVQDDADSSSASLKPGTELDF